MLAPADFFDLSEPFVNQFFTGCPYVWQAVERLPDHVKRLVGQEQRLLGQISPDAYISDRSIYVAADAVVEPGAYLLGPAYIGAGAVVRHGAYVREHVVLSPGSILGHASEAKNTLLLPGAAAPHFNYLGDSILGWNVNLGAGTKLSNLTLVSQKDPRTGQRPTLRLVVDGQTYDTHLAKLGAILGDGVETGCNAVLNPGCLVGRQSLIYANMSLRKGYYPDQTIIKLRQESELADRRM
ncbi:MAG: hypothetical protein R3300_06950 [Candidatus Promineifilaceae bacterium]|nr:hypothetical protein [Candidatus Promineifilaceae bacterium]